MNPEVEKQLQQCKTLQEMFEVLQLHYDLTNCKVGTISKPQIIHGLKFAVKILKPVERK